MNNRPSKNLLLSSLSAPYWWITRVRNAFYDKGLLSSTKSLIPVVSIGNITVGGTGKSPFTQYVARGLVSRGFEPVILTRGYGGNICGPHLLNCNDTPKSVGDEACMHRKVFGETVPIVVSRDRVAGSRFITDKRLGNCIVLDDGFQHRRLARDLDIVMIDVSTEKVTNDWRAGMMLPAGTFREDRDQALKRANHVIAVCRGLDEDQVLRAVDVLDEFCPTTSHSIIRFTPVRVYDAITGDAYSEELCKNLSVKAVCGIAKPDSFERLLGDMGMKVKEMITYPDHYEFDKDDLRKILSNSDCPVITTEKDIVKLLPLIELCDVNLRDKLLVLAIELKFISDCEEGWFWDTVSGMLVATISCND